MLDAAGEPPLAPGLAGEIRQGLAALQFQGALEKVRYGFGRPASRPSVMSLHFARPSPHVRNGAAQGQERAEFPRSGFLPCRERNALFGRLTAPPWLAVP